MNVTAQKFQSQCELVCKPSARRNQRTTLPQSALRAASSLREGAWWGAFPAPSLRELSSECETEGVYYDERNRSKISEPIKNCE